MGTSLPSTTHSRTFRWWSQAHRVDHQCDSVVQHADIVRTLFAHLGLAAVREFDPAYTRPDSHPGMLTAIRSTAYKLLYSDDAVELFALPDESTDIAATHPEQVERMRTDAEEWLAGYDSQATGAAQELDETVKTHLTEMGYLV